MAAPSLAVTGRKDGYLMSILIKELETQVRDYGGQGGDDEQQVELLEPVDAAEWLGTNPDPPDQILEDVCDRGDKLAIIAPSKMRKSFLLLMFILSLAAGRDFLGWRVPKERRVLLVQFEIQPNHYHRRVKRMADSMGITPADLADRLQIVNARGLGISGEEGIQEISEIAKRYGSEVICLDPLYKISQGVENAMEDGRIILNAFDKMARDIGAAIVYVHHDSKGNPGEKAIQDRGAGSNILARDYDACITLTPHASDPEAAIVETLLRNYRSQKPFAIRWTEAGRGGGQFVVRPDMAPTKVKRTSKSIMDSPALESYLPTALDLLKNGPMPITVFMDTLRTRTCMTYSKLNAFRVLVTAGPDAALDTVSNRGRGLNDKVIGTAEQIRQLRGQNEKKK